MESGAEVVLVDTEKIAGAVEAADAGTLRRAVAATGDTLPVGALLGVIAEAAIPDAEIDAFVQQFQDTFVPEEAGGEEAGDQTETVQDRCTSSTTPATCCRWNAHPRSTASSPPSGTTKIDRADRQVAL